MNLPSPITQKSDPVKAELITLATVKSRGWSPSLITKLLGEPDKLKTNPHNYGGAKMQLFALERVEAAELDADFIAHQKRRVQMSIRAKAAGRQRRAEEAAELREFEAASKERLKALLVQIAEMPVHIKELSLDQVRREAMQSWIDSRPDWQDDIDPYNADKSTVERWMVNYIRHDLSSYHEALGLIDDESDSGLTEGDTGKAARAIRDCYLKAIQKVYPTLSRAAGQQLPPRGC